MESQEVGSCTLTSSRCFLFVSWSRMFFKVKVARVSPFLHHDDPLTWMPWNSPFTITSPSLSRQPPRSPACPVA